MRILNEIELAKEILIRDIYINIEMAKALIDTYDNYEYKIGIKDEEFYRVDKNDPTICDLITLRELINLSTNYNDIIIEDLELEDDLYKLDILNEALNNNLLLTKLKNGLNKKVVWSINYIHHNYSSGVKVLNHLFDSYIEMEEFYINNICNNIKDLYKVNNVLKINAIIEKNNINIDIVSPYSIQSMDGRIINMQLNHILI